MDHDHTSHAAHAGFSTHNFEAVARAPLITDATGATPPGIVCGDASLAAHGRALTAMRENSGVAFEPLE